MTPATLNAILELHDEELSVQEIAGQTCVSADEVKAVIAKHRPVASRRPGRPAARRDERIEAVLADGEKSARQSTRTLAARARAVLDDLTAAVARERAEAALVRQEDELRRRRSELDEEIRRTQQQRRELRSGRKAGEGQ